MSTKKKKLPKEKDDFKEIIADNHFRSVKLNIRNYNLTDKQKSFAQIAFDKNTKIIFINGPAGSSKTFLAVYCALHIMNMNQRSELKYIRTIAESGERALGSLPGTVDEKFNPFMMPLYDKLDELLPLSQSKYLETNGFIEALPINFLRGATWNDKLIIADESQNYSSKELVTLLTRIGENTKMFICGDAMQSDIGNKSGFMRVYDLFNNKESEEKGIFCFQFDEEDIMRSEILKYIVNVFKRLDKTNPH
jgi:phosphate starvation-inducible PhoH-like protein